MQRATAGYSRAGDVAAEVISAIRTVVAFGGQQREVDRSVWPFRRRNRDRSLYGKLTDLCGIRD